MTNNELIERYVYATTKLLPSKSRDDIGKELRANIDDMLDARCGDVTPTENDVKVVLTELGTPDSLAEKYSTDKQGHLVGGVYYMKWKLVLAVSLMASVAGVTLATILESVVNKTTLLQAASDIVGRSSTTALACFAIVTIIFAALERKGVSISKADSLDELPAVPAKSNRISVGEPIVGIILGVLGTVLFLGFPQVISIGTVSLNGKTEIIRALDVASVRAAWLPILIFAMAGLVKECIQLIEARYSKSVLVSTVIANVVSIGAACFWLLRYNVLSADAVTKLGSLATDAEGTAFLNGFADNFQMILLGIIVFALVLDTVVTVIKCVKNKD